MTDKICSKCNLTKNILEFYRNKDSRDGFRSWCKKCCHEQTTRYRTEHADTVRQQDVIYSKNYRAKKMLNPRLCKAKDMIYNARRRAKEKGIPFAITLDDFSWQTQDYCKAFPWVKLVWDNPKWQDDSPSLDRIDNSLGYIPGNIEIISLRANKTKGDASFREIDALYEYISLREIS